MSAPPSHRWRHFDDLPSNFESLANNELIPLRNVWLEQKASLEEAGLVTTFTQRLVREYAIEGGIIERAYTLDRGITEILIDRVSRPASFHIRRQIRILCKSLG